MDFTLPPEIEDIRLRTRAFVEEHVLPLEADPGNYDEHENIRLDLLAAPCAPRPRPPACGRRRRRRNSAAWACRSSAWAAMYEEANRSIFGPVASTAPRPTTAT